MSKIAIIAAMEREIAPLVRGWQRGTLSSGERKFVIFDRDQVVAAVSGIGCKNAELAARAVVAQHRPALLI
jgi:nucleoside phosphorylase